MDELEEKLDSRNTIESIKIKLKPDLHLFFFLIALSFRPSLSRHSVIENSSLEMHMESPESM